MPKHNAEFVASVVASIRAGESIRGAAKRHSVAESTVRGWIKKAVQATEDARTEDVRTEDVNATEDVQADARTTEDVNASATPEDASSADVAMPEDVRTEDATEDASQAPTLPIRFGDIREFGTNWREFIQAYTITTFFDCVMGYTTSTRYPNSDRVTRDGVPVNLASSVRLTPIFHPTHFGFRLDDFVFSGVHRGYQVAIDHEGIIREYRCDRMSGPFGETLSDHDFVPFSQCFNELPNLILDYVSQFFPVVYAQPVAFPVPTRREDARTEDATEDATPDAVNATEDDDATEDATECEDCGCSLSDPDDVMSHDGCDYCQPCYDDRFIPCHRCEDATDCNDAITINGDDYCESCVLDHFTRCGSCREYTPDDETHCTSSGRTICNECYESDYFYCDSCNEVIHNEHYWGDGICEACHDARGNGESDVIQCYSDKSADRMTKLGNPKDDVYFGVELEVCSSDPSDRSEDASEVLSTLGEDFVVLKEDSSLPTGGFEIVTCPATVQVHASRFKALMVDNPVRGLKSWDASGCGMHVHVSRKPLTKLQIGKMIAFVNDDANSRLITAIAGRSSNGYCHRSAGKKVTTICNRSWDNNRYEAINLTNSHTIEFRIFRGTLKYSSFMKNLEFVASMVAFSRVAGLNELTQGDYLGFVASRKLTYPHLYAYLTDRQFITAKPSRRVLAAIGHQSTMTAEV